MEAKVVKRIAKQLSEQETLRSGSPRNLASNYGVPGATRTRDPLLRRQLLYPAELQGQYLPARLDFSIHLGALASEVDLNTGDATRELLPLEETHSHYQTDYKPACKNAHVYQMGMESRGLNHYLPDRIAQIS